MSQSGKMRAGYQLLALCLVLLLGACQDKTDGGSSGANTNNGANNGGQNNTNNGDVNNGVNNGANNGANNGGQADMGDAGGDMGDADAGDVDVPCEEGARRCAGPSQVEECQGGTYTSVEICQQGEVCNGQSCATQQGCEPGFVAGCFNDSSRSVCNEAGTGFVTEACPDGLNCLQGECTSAICLPGERYCADRDNVQVCNEAGDGYTAPEACPAGSLCFDGACLSGCELSEKFPSYIGCKYWSLDLDQYNDPAGDPSVVPHAVVLSNPGERDAHVRISTQAEGVVLNPDQITVPPGEVVAYTFPRLDVDGTGITSKSFYLESDWPVVAYQFNPLNNEGVASNDASLLLPAEFLGTEYIALSWPTSPRLGNPDIPLPEPDPQYGYVTIVATRPGITEVTVVPSTNVQGGPNIPFLQENLPHVFNLRQYQVLNLQTEMALIFTGQINKDLSGTIIQASQPIAVFGGHEEAVVGNGCCAEHLEQQLFPVSTWGQRYLAVQSEPRGGGEESGDVWRIVAAYNNTQVQTIPPQPGAGSVTLRRGEWIEIDTQESFEVVASLPVMVGQYLKSQELVANATGDPAFILAVPLENLRDDYTVLTPARYSTNWLTVARPVGAVVLLDGVEIPSARFTTFGSGEWEYAWIQVQEGPHHVEGDQPFALTAYGYSTAVSYGYPGGLNLRVRDGQ